MDTVLWLSKMNSELDGVKTVEGNPEAKSIEVEWEAPITEGKIKETLKEINYPPA